MARFLIATFAQPCQPLKKWINFLQSLGINGVFLNPEEVNSRLLFLLAKSKIKVFLEFGVFSNDPLLWKKIPQARVVDRNGKVLKSLTFNRKPVCPSNSKVRKIKLENLDNMTKKNSLDGVWLDGLRFPSAWEKKVPENIETCFCLNCLKNFATFLGIKLPSNYPPDWPLRLYPQQWLQWRSQQLADFLKEAKAIIKQNRPKTKLGLFIVPLTKKEFGGAITKIFAQDIVVLSKHADIISPMLYHRMCGHQPDWIKKSVKYFVQLTKKPILPAIQTRDMPESLPNRITTNELKNAVNLALSPPSKGVILFTLDNALTVFPSDKIRQIIHKAVR